ncbi:MAG: polysaccharide biosynthesis tyrosine autokinase [Richelia sp. RM2_1_2]|nr:polysaccharide biosynthesis tyrosine autokinase [Richelia sp. SM2_1_7]NJM21124.1 polysaccharide biosynthesis tyrosine autokinase [Richelia sp. SM1_7_0]NJN12044.1 polysaccharide biosynthesis tyrosine autokinase [Richelia sp. RM1_1_1]NJO28728.1 polysaccharide biosynthesis tyrosine autokinase [Richelia sp. SL_2_1]NJO61376.1 polysaccharide biosynthesis tyrosine autokinase [Richelia sp. RM2_1_2]NJS16049.1 polysaccharide biosynthesis tyrosine autokinase [Nostocaceae cyanobacterium CSU_2_110]
MLKSDKNPYLFSQAGTPLNDVEEGGLNLGQVGAALRRRALLIVGVTGVVATAAVLKAESEPPIYQGQFDILTQPVTGEGKAIANLPQTLGSRDAIAPPETEKDVATTIQVLKSPLILNPVVENLQSKYPNLEYESFIKGLVIGSKQKDILTVGYVAGDQQLVSDVLKEIADAYLNYSLKERQQDIDQAINFVQGRITNGGLRQRVEELQNKLRTLRSVNNLIEPAQQSQQVSAQISSFTQQQLENRVQYEQMLAQYQELQKELAQQPGERVGNSILSENPRYQRILDEIQKIQIETKSQSAVFTDNNPTIQALQQKTTNLIPMLNAEENRVQNEFQNRIQTLQARDLSLSDKIERLNAELRNLATVTRDYENIQRELQIATEGLNQFLTKQQALEIEKSQKQQPWRLLDPQLTKVEQPEAVSQSARRNLALGGALGLLLGVGAALVIDKLSNVYYTSKDLKETTRLPLLGVVPFSKELAASAKQDAQLGRVHQATRAAFFEVFRSLYTNILLLGSDTPIRSLVVSSATPEDGKTTVAIQLALAAAAMGQRVLLVDANLRCPTIHQRVGLMNIQGLTDVISSELEWSNVIERSPLEDNLYVMAAGPIPPDSTRLLASVKMQDLMNELHNSFDLVIYDTTPIVGFADANLLAANTNGVMLVAGLGKLKRTAFAQALEEIQVSGTAILGLVANKSKESTAISQSNYQQYYKMSVERVGEDDLVESRNSSSVSKIKLH